MTVPTDPTELRDVVRARYAAAATASTKRNATCCGAQGTIITDEQREQSGSPLYDAADREQLPDAAVLASLGCGNPLAIADLHDGETVLDLGSGGGIDVLLSAQRVGPTGRVYGLDVTDEMLDLARRNQAEAGALTRDQFTGALTDAGLTDITITETHRVHTAAAPAIVRATKPDVSCCSTTVQASCCTPGDKEACCDTALTSSGGCGCR